MRDLKIVFMGTPDFAVASLKALITAGYSIAGVVTSPDKPAGRGRKMQQSAVKKFAVKHHLPVLQPVNLKSEAFLDELKALNANLQVVVAFRMLPRVVWNMPAYGTFNLHASLLPDYRGAAPINWVLINGETKTGVTTFFIDEKIDTGALILKEEIPVSENETAGSLHDTLMTRGSQLVLQTVKLIANNTVKTISQPDDTAGLKKAPKLDNDNRSIDWKDSLEAIYNKIRGLNPYPGAISMMENKKKTYPIKIYRAEKKYQQHNNEPGSIQVTGKELKVAVSGGFIDIKEMQLPGKKQMNTKDLLNGFRFESDARMF